MKKITLLFAFFIGNFCFAQLIETTNGHIAPKSIYTISSNTFLNQFYYSSTKKSLNLKSSYNFSTVSFNDIDNQLVLISSDNLLKTNTSFIYDDYKSYQDKIFLNSFLQKHDPTRWSFCNFIPPAIN